MTRRRCLWTVVGAVLLSASLWPVLADARYRLIDRWESPEGYGEFTKFVVLGISDIKENRHQFENNFVSQLRGRDIEAVASYTIVRDLVHIDDADRERIIRTLEQENVDGVITVRAVPLGDITAEQWIAEWKERLGAGGTIRELIDTTLPVSAKSSKRYGVELTVWDANSRQRVWAGRTEPLTRREIRKGVPEFVQRAMDAFVAVGLV